MSTTTTGRVSLLSESQEVCARCHRGDGQGLTGWLGVPLCAVCLLVAKARRALRS